MSFAKIIKFSLVCYLLLNLQACNLLNGTKKCTISGVTDGSEIVAYNGYTSSAATKLPGDGNVQVTLNRNYRESLIVNSKPGYKTNSFFISRNQISPLMFLDIAVAAGMIGGGAYLLNDEQNVGIGLVLGGLYLGGYTLGSPTTFPGKAKAEPLVPLPVKEKNQRYMFVDKVSLKIEKGTKLFDYYRSYTNFKNKIKSSSSKASEPVVIEETKATEELNSVLKNLGYLDTTNSFVPNNYNSVNVNMEITGLHFEFIGYYYRINLTGKYKFQNKLDDQVLLQKELKSTSSWQGGDHSEYGFYDAIENAFIDLIKDKEVIELLNKNEETYLKEISTSDTIALGDTANCSRNLAQSVASTVTIVSKTGHGSGFFISKSGHILTNFHVTGSDASKLEVVTSTGEKLKPTVVRFNQVYDICILKVEKEVEHPIYVGKTDPDMLGEEVYAIGTPSSEELSQTVSKGIVSGYRNFDSRKFLQTDVKVSPGNSGGCLISKKGQLLGVVSAKLVGGGTEGIGFAIPLSEIQKALNFKY